MFVWTSGFQYSLAHVHFNMCVDECKQNPYIKLLLTNIFPKMEILTTQNHHVPDEIASDISPVCCEL